MWSLKERMAEELVWPDSFVGSSVIMTADDPTKESEIVLLQYTVNLKV